MRQLAKSVAALAKGLPAVNPLASIAFVTTLPAPMVVLSPMVTPGHVIALLTAALSLALIGLLRFETGIGAVLGRVIRVGGPVNQWVSYVIVLGLPSTIGGAAGRLAV